MQHAPGYSAGRADQLFTGLNAKQKEGAPCFKIIENFKAVTAEHRPTMGPF